MTQQIEQLALTRLAFEISNTVPDMVIRDLDQSLWYAHAEKPWANGVPISDQERESIFATEVFTNLGNMSLRLMYNVEPSKSLESNPLFESADEVLSTIIPRSDSSFDDILGKVDMMNISSYDIDLRINNIFEKIPDYMGEYWTKRCLALNIFKSTNRETFTTDHASGALSGALNTLAEARTAIEQMN